MEPGSNQIEQLFINKLKLPENEWRTVQPLLRHINADKRFQVNGDPGDLFFLASGFLVEMQVLGDSEIKMVRLFEQNEVFVFPDRIRDTYVIPTEKSSLLRLGADHREKMKKLAVGLFQIWDNKEKSAAEIYTKRQELLSGRKNLRYERFLKEFPGAASHLTNQLLAGYLDVNVTYLSTCKNLSRKKS